MGERVPKPRHGTPCRKRRASTARSGVSTTKDSERKVQIPRKLFDLVHSLFLEHDGERDGVISQEEFVKAVQSHNGDESQGATLQRKVRPSAGETLRTHAADMYESVIRRSQQCQDANGITLASFCALYFPHLPFCEVERACRHYTYRPPTPPPRETTLDDIEGGREEICDIFEALDSDHDGFVRMKSLEPMLQRIGVSREEVAEWLGSLPNRGVQRTLSKIDKLDLVDIMAPSYVARVEGPAKDLTMDEIQRQHEWNEEIYMQLISAH